jgi:glucokinase
MIAGVDIGGTKIAVGMIDAEGRLRSRLESPTSPDLGYAKALDRIVEMLGSAATKAGEEISGIGIGSTGPVDAFSGEIGEVNFFPAWKGENPVKDLQRIFRVPVALENDADAAALGEAGWGAGRNRSKLLYVTVGTGIGVGVILDGKVYRGAGRAHPEIGHFLLDPSGPPCAGCGFHGCWESLAAGPGMVAWLKKNAPPDYLHREGLTAERICELAREKEEWALRAVEYEGTYLGYGLASLVTLFIPEVIVLGGGLMKSADLFLGRVRQTIAASCGLVPHEKTELSLASLGENANLLGAGRVWYDRFGPKGGGRAA